MPNPDYRCKPMVAYSEGVKEVIGETVAYVYAQVSFMAAALDATISGWQTEKGQSRTTLRRQWQRIRLI